MQADFDDEMEEGTELQTEHLQPGDMVARKHQSTNKLISTEVEFNSYYDDDMFYRKVIEMFKLGINFQRTN